MAQAERLLNIIFEVNPYQDFPINAETVDIRPIHNPIFYELISYLKPQIIIEVGTWKGASAIHMGSIIKSLQLDTAILCVDTWLGSPEHWLDKRKDNVEWGFHNLKLVHGYPSLYTTFLNNVKSQNLQDVIVPLPMSSDNAAEILKRLGLSSELIYIDAAHEYESVYRDLNLYWNLLSGNGVMFGDDYIAWPGVTAAANDFAMKQANNRIFGQFGTFVIPKGAIDLKIVMNSPPTP
jgi:predicted O-methyltransferase YrrM